MPQQYRPSSVEGRTYYEPSEHGFEAEVARRLRARADGPVEDDGPTR